MATRQLLKISDLNNYIRNNFGLEPETYLLKGDLGSGKTTFVRHFLEWADGNQIANSPTFALHQIYSCPTGPINHFDLYRIETDSELESIGFPDLIANPLAINFIEWPEIAKDYINNKATIINFSYGPTPDSRYIEVLR